MSDQKKFALAPAVPAESSEIPVASLVDVHHHLTRQLAVLDSIGEHVAAAHLIAAIDMIEDRLDTTGGHRASGEGSRIQAIARDLIEQFGDRALGVSQRQCQQSSGMTSAIWSAISNRIEVR